MFIYICAGQGKKEVSYDDTFDMSPKPKTDTSVVS